MTAFLEYILKSLVQIILLRLSIYWVLPKGQKVRAGQKKGGIAYRPSTSACQQLTVAGEVQCEHTNNNNNNRSGN